MVSYHTTSCAAYVQETTYLVFLRDLPELFILPIPLKAWKLLSAWNQPHLQISKRTLLDSVVYHQPACSHQHSSWISLLQNESKVMDVFTIMPENLNSAHELYIWGSRELYEKLSEDAACSWFQGHLLGLL